MNVIASTGQKELDALIQQLTKTPIPPVAYREGVVKIADRYKPQIVILSAFLDGHIATEQVLHQLRKQGARIIMLIGHTHPKEIREKWLPLGVYDFITDPVTEEKIYAALMNPATLGHAEEQLTMLESGQDPNQVEKTKRHSHAQKEQKSIQPPKEQNWIPASDSPGTRAKQHITPSGQWPYKPEGKVIPSTGKTHTQMEGQSTSAEIHTIQKGPGKEKGKNSQTAADQKREKTPSYGQKEAWSFGDVAPSKMPFLTSGAYTIVVMSPASTGKTYVAMNVAAVLSKQGHPTELVAFSEEEAIWTYFDLPKLRHGSPKGLPNMMISTFSDMTKESYYRIIDLPFERWREAQEWHDVLFLYVTDMDLAHRKSAQRQQEQWQGRRLLHILNRFVPNVLDAGQEQKMRMEADIVFTDQPSHFLAMRFGRTVAMTEQSATREFEMAVKTICTALPSTEKAKVRPIS